MGIMNDIGVLDSSNNLTENAWRAYVDDVKKKLEKGTGGTGFPVPCAPKDLPPNAGAPMLALEDKALFPEFYNLWHPRYEQMARDLNAEGAYNLAKTTGLPIVDPTAMATTLGMPMPSMSLDEAIGHIIVPPASPIELFEVMGMSPADLADPIKVADMTTSLMEAIAVPPLPPLGLPADPVQFAKIEEFGYTEWYAYEKDLLLTPVKTYTELLSSVTEIPNMLGNIPNGLVETVCGAAEPSQPKRMETSSTEEAASQTLKEHQVKLQSCNFLGTNIGSGGITKGVAEGPLEVAKPAQPTTPPAEEPQSPPEESEEEVDYTKPPAEDWGKDSGWPSSSSSSDSGGGSYDDSSSEDAGQSYGGGIMTPRRSYIINEIANKMFTYEYKGTKCALFGTRKAWGGNYVESGPQGGVKNEAALGTSYFQSTGATTCGLFPPWIFKILGATPEKDPELWLTGKINPYVPGPTGMAYWGICADVWVWAYGPGKGNRTPTGKFPNPGDIFTLGKAGGGANGSGGDPVTGTKWSMNPPEPWRTKLKETIEVTPDCGVTHVGVVVSFDPVKGMMRTADFGQKPLGGLFEGGCYRDRKIYKEPNTGRWKIQGENVAGHTGDRYLMGWIDIDKVKINNPNA